MLRRRIEGLMGKSARRKDPPWWDVSRDHWDLLWTGEEELRKYGTILWETGHKSITLFPVALEGPIHRVLQQSGDGSQTKHAQVPFTKRVPAGARHTLQSYLNLVDWEHILGGTPGKTLRTGLPPRSSPSVKRDTIQSQPLRGKRVRESQISFMNQRFKS